MSYLPTKVYNDTIASGASTSAGFAIAEGYSNFIVQVPTMSTSAQIAVHHSTDNGSTWYDLWTANVLTSTVQYSKVLITSALGTNGGAVALNLGGLRYIRFMASGVVSGGVGFKVVCSD